ncbi:HNH endonuclease [Mesorhizobium sp. M0871]|uniref:HNH endonuclease n=1 Tax=unclassified Mesorhizobium TaxID=325217 RepID=UPI0003CF0021|nr:HNH endonuclease [Mesorhizobium sp. LNJC391B00]ESY29205.1 restriction endonuclease [Mesorhizobium sp. LNJC391B00]
MKAVFDLKRNSGYKDSEGRYHFPARYLEGARKAVGDWVLYREPRRNGGRRAYVAAARVISVEPDPERAGHYYAHVADYLDFPTPVPFVNDGRYAETLLRTIVDPSRVGQAVQGKSIRPILIEDFDDIVLAGLSETLDPANARKLGLDILPVDVSFPTHMGMAEAVDRRVEQILLNRKVRDATFRLEVCRAYGDTCAVTGLRIINGGGRAEVQAAHIKPVAAGGPDVVQNGIALSATVHWLFDRHLISIDENHRLLVAHNRVPSELRNLFRPDHQGLHLPSDPRLWPNPAFLAHHRNEFAGAIH